MAFPNLNFARPVLPNNRIFCQSLKHVSRYLFSLLGSPAGSRSHRPHLSCTVSSRTRCMPKTPTCEPTLRCCSGIFRTNLCFGCYIVYRDMPLEKVRTFLFLTPYLLDLSVPVVCSSALYASAGTIIDPGGDITQAHFRREGMVSPHLLCNDN